MTIRPSNDGNWQPEVAQTAWAEIAGNKVTIHNFRNFDYRTSTDFVPHWETKVPGVTHAKEISTRMNVPDKIPLLGKLISADRASA
jgi:hypothetical protein